MNKARNGAVMRNNLKILLFFASGFSGIHYSFPLGLTCIASYMDDKGPFCFRGITTQYKRRDPRSDNPVWDEINSFAPDVVFMTMAPANSLSTLRWAEAMKRRIPGVVIVLGGFLATFVPDEILKRYPFIDFVSVFEGEESMLALGKTLLEESKDYATVPNLVWRGRDGIIRNPVAPRFDMGKLKRFKFDYFDEINSTGTVSFMVSRGCPVLCNSRICGGYWGGGFSIMPAECLSGMLAELSGIYPNVSNLMFYDYVSIPAVRKLLTDVLPRFPKYTLDLRSHLEGLDERAVAELAAINAKSIYFYSTPLAKSAARRRCKEIPTDNAAEVIALLRKYKINFTFPVHIGTPGETFEELHETFSILDDLDIRDGELEVTFGTYVQPGSIDYERLLEKYPGFQWFGEQNLDKDFFYIKTPSGHVVSVMSAGTEYDYSSFSSLRNLPLMKYYSYEKNQSSSAPFDISEITSFVNYGHISREMRAWGGGGVNPEIYAQYIRRLNMLRAACGGKPGCRERILALLGRLNKFLDEQGKSIVVIAGSFYTERTIGKTDWSSLKNLKTVHYVDSDASGQIPESDYILLHLNPVAVGNIEPCCQGIQLSTDAVLSGKLSPEDIHLMPMDELLARVRVDSSREKEQL